MVACDEDRVGPAGFQRLAHRLEGNGIAVDVGENGKSRH